MVTSGKAVVTFNDAINNLHNVTGWGEFEIEGRNFSDASGENTGRFRITSGGKTAEVSVVKPASGTTGVFYYKTGDMQTDDTDHVRWFLMINNEKAYVDGDIRIEDEIQSGQTLDADSFDVTVTDYNNQTKSYRGQSGISQLANDFGAVISANSATGRIVVTIPQGYASLTNFSIVYLTKVDDPKQKTFKNNSKAWYKENGKEAVNGREFNHSVANVNAAGGIDGNTTTTAEPTTTTTEIPTTTEASTTTTEGSTTTTETPTTTTEGSITTTEASTTTTEGSTTTTETSTTTTEGSTTEVSGTTEASSETTKAEETTTKTKELEKTATSDSAGSSSNKPNKSSGKQNAGAKGLPSTGEESGTVLSLLGLAAVSVIGLFYYRKYHS